MAEYNKDFENLYLKNKKPMHRPKRKLAIASSLAAVLLAGAVGFATFLPAPSAEDTSEAVKTEEPSISSWGVSRYYSSPATTKEPEDEDVYRLLSKDVVGESTEETADGADASLDEAAPETPSPEPEVEQEQEPAPEPEPVEETAPAPEPDPEPVAEPQAQETVYEEVQQIATEPETETVPAPEPVAQAEVLSKETMSLPDYVSRKALPSVVSVVAENAAGAGQGTGIVISSDGLVVTAFHVLRPNENTITITCNGKEYPARIRGYSATSDVALLQMQLNGDVVTPIKIADSNFVHVGDWVMSMGAPTGMLEYTYGSVTELDYNSSITFPEGYSSNYYNTIGSSAWSTCGYSGGPLLDEDGRLIGMNVFITNRDSGVDAWLESFAIPSNQISSIVNSILTQ